jgi:hypothetical protein
MIILSTLITATHVIKANQIARTWAGVRGAPTRRLIILGDSLPLLRSAT